MLGERAACKYAGTFGVANTDLKVVSQLTSYSTPAAVACLLVSDAALCGAVSALVAGAALDKVDARVVVVAVRTEPVPEVGQAGLTSAASYGG